MSVIMCKRTVSGLSPDDDAASAVLRKVPLGAVVKVEVRRPRNLSAHRRWFALCNLIYQNCEQYASPDVVHGHLKILAGHATPIVSHVTGETWLIPNSISFSSLDEDAFQQVWRRACQAVCETILPTLTVSDLDNEIMRIVGHAIPVEQTA